MAEPPRSVCAGAQPGAVACRHCAGSRLGDRPAMMLRGNDDDDDRAPEALDGLEVTA
jgi:hypothetical protein